MSFGSSDCHLFRKPLSDRLSSSRVVKDCPVGGTNCRGSSQIRQRRRMVRSSKSNWAEGWDRKRISFVF